MLVLSRLADMAAKPHRDDFLLFATDSTERAIAGYTDQDILSKKVTIELNFPFEPPHPSRDETHDSAHSDHHGRAGFGIPPRRPGPTMWLVSETGDVLYSSRNLPLDGDWAALPKSGTNHQISVSQDFFRLKPGLFIIKLERPTPLYVVVRDDHRPLSGPLLMTQSALTFGTVATALFFSLSFTFFYLRRKSAEAQTVLSRLERGDLRARFNIQRIDEFGGLMLGFNRMADEIEKLVTRVHKTESTRRSLLQELSHDLRTPLTSLTTSFEVLKFHFSKLTELERVDLFEMVAAEVEYLRELIEKLMTIATLDEPHYKQTTEAVEISQLLLGEIKNRLSQQKNDLQWDMQPIKPDVAKCVIHGDTHLLQRLIKNAFDNAARFAQTRVTTELRLEGQRLEIIVTDDGPGLSPAELETFGKRREQRRRREGTGLNFSLGLGSVIMRTIAELHQGSIKIENLKPPDASVVATEGGTPRRPGARLTITFQL
jgi:signal transduction histidine kinase